MATETRQIDVDGEPFEVELDLEDSPDNRHIADVKAVPGAMAYGATPEEAIEKVREILRQARQVQTV